MFEGQKPKKSSFFIFEQGYVIIIIGNYVSLYLEVK